MGTPTWALSSLVMVSYGCFFHRAAKALNTSYSSVPRPFSSVEEPLPSCFGEVPLSAPRMCPSSCRFDESAAADDDDDDDEDDDAASLVPSLL